MNMQCWSVVAALSLALASGTAGAATIPFTEDFTSTVEGWEDNANDPLTWVASGGPDGSSYASGAFDFTDFVAPFPGAGPIVFRAQDEDNASGGAFIGDYVSEGVLSASAWVRHDAPVAMELILRVATASNFPGAAIASADGSVLPNTWTQVFFSLDPDSGFCTAETFTPGATCSSAASLENIGHFQLGYDAPQPLIDDGVTVTFDVDQASLSADPVPEPTALALVASGLLGLGRLGRRRRV